MSNFSVNIFYEKQYDVHTPVSLRCRAQAHD